MISSSSPAAGWKNGIDGTHQRRGVAAAALVLLGGFAAGCGVDADVDDHGQRPLDVIATSAPISRAKDDRSSTKATATPTATGRGVPLPSYPAPTADIAAVVNAMSYDYKSLSTAVTVSPGLSLTQPVTISIGYFPSGVVGFGRYCQQRLTQAYSASTGNSFLCALPEGDGRPRPMHLDITLSEPSPDGGQYYYNVPVDMTLDPLYDVEISPLTFQLIVGCSNIGANQIDLKWYAPDASQKRVHFASQEGETFSISEFAWAQSEVSAGANLYQPLVWYDETGYHGIIQPGFGPGGPALGTPDLVPGKTFRSGEGLISSFGSGYASTRDCRATIDYTVTYAFRTYFGAAPQVRDHR